MPLLLLQIFICKLNSCLVKECHNLTYTIVNMHILYSCKFWIFYNYYIFLAIIAIFFGNFYLNLVRILLFRKALFKNRNIVTFFVFSNHVKFVILLLFCLTLIVFKLLAFINDFVRLLKILFTNCDQCLIRPS